MFKLKKILLLISHAILIITILFTSGCKSKYKNLDLSMYQYRDTKHLVQFVSNAALILEKDGMKSLDYFRNNRELYCTKDNYLYIYDMTGKNLFHAGMEHLENKDLLDVTDKDGKEITQLVLSALEDKNNPHSWVHYSWWEPGKFYPVPKSSCHFKVKTSDGKELYIGGGLNFPHEEKEFIRIIVDNAVKLIEKKGKKSFDYISNPESQYNFRDVCVFAFQKNGKILISPVINDNYSQIKLLDCVDEAGHKPFEKAIKILDSKNSVWIVFLAKDRYQRTLIKKCLYLRKANMAGNNIFVGAITDLPQPPY